MIIQDLAANIVKTRFEDFDKAVVQAAKTRVIDIVGCAIGGANASGCNELKQLMLEWGGQPQATVFVHGKKLPAHNAAMLNSIMARSYDFGVITPFIGDKPVWAHIAETNIPTAITVADWKHATGKELLTALILGDDLSTRIAASSTRSISQGWDTPGTVNKFGAAAIVCKLSHQSEFQIINAFGIVLNQLAGSFHPIFEGAHCFKLAQGLAARDAITASQMAGKGWTGGSDPLLGKFGYFALYCQQNDPIFLTRNLGKEFYGDCMFKPYPSCRFIHSSIDCALDLVSKYDINPAEISTITIDVAPMHVNSSLDQPFVLGEFPQGNVTFSLRYNVANVLLRKKVNLEHFTEKMIRDPAIAKLAQKANIISTLSPEKIEAARLKIKMLGGNEYSSYTEVAKGHPLQKPMSKNEIEDKFRANVTFSNTISPSNSERLLELLNNLEQLENMDSILRLLVA
jgi:2-methylcitrate dehydratase PrpD